MFAKLSSKQRAAATSRNLQYKTQSYVTSFCLLFDPLSLFHIFDIIASASSVRIYNLDRREKTLNEKVCPDACLVVSVNMLS